MGERAAPVFVVFQGEPISLNPQLFLAEGVSPGIR